MSAVLEEAGGHILSTATIRAGWFPRMANFAPQPDEIQMSATELLLFKQTFHPYMGIFNIHIQWAKSQPARYSKDGYPPEKRHAPARTA